LAEAKNATAIIRTWRNIIVRESEERSEDENDPEKEQKTTEL
jgi:hypothetical protein